MVGTARDVFVIAVADVFICSFNDNGANKQSQIKINFVATPCVRLDSLKTFLGDAHPPSRCFRSSLKLRRDELT
jgi:hypothetical protein